MKTRSAVMSTLATLALLASAAVTPGNAQPLSHLLHLHPGASSQPDGRVTVHLYNNGTLWKELMVNGKVYTLDAHTRLDITAPVGTPVYAVSNVAFHRRGDLVLTVDQRMRGQSLDLR